MKFLQIVQTNDGKASKTLASWWTAKVQVIDSLSVTKPCHRVSTSRTHE